MADAKTLAEQAAVTSFLNCYLRETGKGIWHPGYELGDSKALLEIPLASQGISIFASAIYKSSTGRHQFELPICCRTGQSPPAPIFGATLFALLAQELHALYGGNGSSELLVRALQSQTVLEACLSARFGDGEELYSPDLTFLHSEQSLLFGHGFHPTPKSRQGFPEWRHGMYSPETKGSFALHYFAVHIELAQHKSEWPKRASDLIEKELLRSCYAAGESVERLLPYLNSPEYELIPVHPVQADDLLHQDRVKQWMQSGKLVHLGPCGGLFYPTSSIRTLYDPESEYMYKLSLRVKITNSLRLNKREELDSALEATRLVSAIEPKMKERFPQFRFIKDSAYMTVGESPEEQSGFELLIRENPFIGEEAERVHVMASFTQLPIPGSQTLLANIAERIATAEGQTMTEAAVEWFRRYLAISIRPLVWLYAEYGIALEAHLQNCVVKLDESGYPAVLYYRDSQGYYYARSRVGRLEQLVPGILDSVNVYDDALAEERFGYYLIVNHMLGLIQSFGLSGLADERVLLLELYSELEQLASPQTQHFNWITGWLSRKTFRCKANLLTRLHDVDELEAELEQAVYVDMDNPLYTALPNMEVVRKARLVTVKWRKERATQHLAVKA
ncbi:IucA/IucC family protein [Paenibacillus sp. GCM10027627]|uniref:IucA/IucC family protein n=1 Tax=unclassified Paenibacillus TaxID=185978 RepID=UPI00363AE4D1